MYKQFREDYRRNPKKWEASNVVFEFICDTDTHTHVKGCLGGRRIIIDDTLYSLNDVKEALKERGNYLDGELIKLLTKSISPLVRMAQAINHQPNEAFIGGFTNSVPHNLTSYQKDNSLMRKELLNRHGICKDDSVDVQLIKLMKSLKQLPD